MHRRARRNEFPGIGFDLAQQLKHREEDAAVGGWGNRLNGYQNEMDGRQGRMYRYVGRHKREREIEATIWYPRHGRQMEVLSVHHYRSPTFLYRLTSPPTVIHVVSFQHLRLREKFVTKIHSSKSILSKPDHTDEP